MINIQYTGLAFAMMATLAACGGSSPGNSNAPADIGVAPTEPPTPLPSAPNTRNRYQFNNACFVLRANGNNQYVAAAGGSYTASAATAAEAEGFYLKPSALGQYMLYNTSTELLTAGTGGVSNLALASATDDVIWTIKGRADAQNYPVPPQVDIEPTIADLDAYLAFEAQDLNTLSSNKFSEFNLSSDSQNQNLTIDGSGNLTTAAAANNNSQSFTLEQVQAAACAEFPEASNSVAGTTYTGNVNDPVVGFADVHVHISATTFLGGAHWGSPFHKFGVTHALPNCDSLHGPSGQGDAIGAFLGSDFDGHDTTGWPTLPDWPAAKNLTHELSYYKWIERAWIAGLRILVNDLVDNETLCELQRNAAQQPGTECNEMAGARDQVGTMYAMQDYIDAQYGGRGEGWWRIVRTPTEARQVIAEGKLAVVLGVEISHAFNCKLTYNPARQENSADEGMSAGRNPATENSYDCSMTENDAADPNSPEINAQLEHLLALGVRQIFPIHEFDNAFGGNGIFDDLVLNLGNREDTGGIPSGDLQAGANLLTPPAGADLAAIESAGRRIAAITNLNTDPQGTGEFWSTYDCPDENDPSVQGYIYDAGSNLQSIPPSACFDVDGGYPGGSTACYQSSEKQCNARWLTPIGLYMLEKLMAAGIIVELDHMELEMKSQTLELALAQTIEYPMVSTHGGHGGISVVQAKQIFATGGIIYPYKGNGRRQIEATTGLGQIHADSQTEFGHNHPFAIGYGADTNGLGAQAGPRENIVAGREVNYPFTLFEGELFDNIPAFNNISGVRFEQPAISDPAGNGRTWHTDMDGMAHYGLAADYVEEVRQESGTDTAALEALYNSAEVYLVMWQRSLDSGTEITNNGIQSPASPILRNAPLPP